MSHKEVADQVGILGQASRQAYVRAKRRLYYLSFPPSYWEKAEETMRLKCPKQESLFEYVSIPGEISLWKRIEYSVSHGFLPPLPGANVDD